MRTRAKIRNMLLIVGTLALSGCEGVAAGKTHRAKPPPDGLAAVREEARGIVAEKERTVTADTERTTPALGMRYYLDVHHLDPTKVNAEAVAKAHEQDLAVQGRHHVEYLDYWFDAKTGTVTCLSQAPSAGDAIAVHQEAHGLLPDSIEEVTGNP